MKILVADDDIILTESLREVLGACGHEVSTAGTGKQVIEKLGQAPSEGSRGFDALILDMRLPDGDGAWVLGIINGTKASLKSYPNLKVIVLTADRERVDQAKIEGAYAVLLKPVDFDVIERVLLNISHPEG